MLIQNNGGQPTPQSAAAAAALQAQLAAIQGTAALLSIWTEQMKAMKLKPEAVKNTVDSTEAYFSEFCRLINSPEIHELTALISTGSIDSIFDSLKYLGVSGELTDGIASIQSIYTAFAKMSAKTAEGDMTKAVTDMLGSMHAVLVCLGETLDTETEEALVKISIFSDTLKNPNFDKKNLKATFDTLETIISIMTSMESKKENGDIKKSAELVQDQINAVIKALVGIKVDEKTIQQLEKTQESLAKIKDIIEPLKTIIDGMSSIIKSIAVSCALIAVAALVIVPVIPMVALALGGTLIIIGMFVLFTKLANRMVSKDMDLTVVNNFINCIRNTVITMLIAVAALLIMGIVVMAALGPIVAGIVSFFLISVALAVTLLAVNMILPDKLVLGFSKAVAFAIAAVLIAIIGFILTDIIVEAAYPLILKGFAFFVAITVALVALMWGANKLIKDKMVLEFDVKIGGLAKAMLFSVVSMIALGLIIEYASKEFILDAVLGYVGTMIIVILTFKGLSLALDKLPIAKLVIGLVALGAVAGIMLLVGLAFKKLSEILAPIRWKPFAIDLGLMLAVVVAIGVLCGVIGSIMMNPLVAAAVSIGIATLLGIAISLQAVGIAMLDLAIGLQAIQNIKIDWKVVDENIKQTVTCVMGAIMGVAEKYPELFEANLFSNSKAMEAIQCVGALGDAIAGLANGVQRMANLQVKDYDDAGHWTGRYRQLNDADFKLASDNTTLIVNTLFKAIMAVAADCPELFNENFFQKSKASVAISCVGQLGKSVSMLAAGIKDMADMSLDEYDALGHRTGKKRKMTQADFAQATANTVLIVNTLFNAVMSAASEHSELFDENFFHKSKASVAISCIGQLGAGVAKIANGVKNVADLRMQVFGPDGKPTGRYTKMYFKDFQQAAANTRNICNTLINAVGDVYDKNKDFIDDSEDFLKALNSLADGITKIANAEKAINPKNTGNAARELKSITDYVIGTQMGGKKWQEFCRANYILSHIGDDMKKIHDLNFSKQQVTDIKDILKAEDKACQSLSKVDLSKLQAITGMLRELTNLSRALNGNFDKLADAISDKLINALGELASEVQKANAAAASAAKAKKETAEPSKSVFSGKPGQPQPAQTPAAQARPGQPPVPPAYLKGTDKLSEIYNLLAAALRDGLAVTNKPNTSLKITAF